MVITQLAQQGGLRPRNKVSPSELLSLLKRSGVNVNIHQLKAFLKYMDLDTVSPLELIEASKSLTNNESGLTSIAEIESLDDDKFPTFVQSDKYADRVREILKNTDLKAFFSQASKGKIMLEVEDFAIAVANKSNGRIRTVEAQKAFEKAAGGLGAMSEEEFLTAFRFYEPSAKTLNHCLKILKN